MKSVQRAEKACSNTCNNSSSKYQYTFGREKRFKQRVLKTQYLDKFYDLPSQITKKGVIFARDKRDLQKTTIEQTPSPCNYNPKEVEPTGQVVFAPGRDNCIANSVFYNTTISYPGPGKYNPEKPQSKRCIRMGGKSNTNYETNSPGPKYNFQSTMLDRYKILSNQRRKGSCRIVLPTSQSRRTVTQSPSSSISVYKSQNEGMMTNKGSRKLGQSGSHAIMPREQRFKSLQMKCRIPGPGHYTKFSEFIQGDAK